jgi:hypothetical protein
MSHRTVRHGTCFKLTQYTVVERKSLKYFVAGMRPLDEACWKARDSSIIFTTTSLIQLKWQICIRVECILVEGMVRRMR